VRKIVIFIFIFFLGQSSMAWPKFQKHRDKLRKGYNYVTQQESTNGGRPKVFCNDPGSDHCKGLQPETGPSSITVSWHTFSTAMLLSDLYMDEQFNLGVTSGEETKTFNVLQANGTSELVTLRITWAMNENSTFEYITTYEEL
jgi:hypothetical protein